MNEKRRGDKMADEREEGRAKTEAQCSVLTFHLNVELPQLVLQLALQHTHVLQRGSKRPLSFINFYQTGLN